MSFFTATKDLTITCLYQPKFSIPEDLHLLKSSLSLSIFSLPAKEATEEVSVFPFITKFFFSKTEGWRLFKAVEYKSRPYTHHNMHKYLEPSFSFENAQTENFIMMPSHEYTDPRLSCNTGIRKQQKTTKCPGCCHQNKKNQRRQKNTHAFRPNPTV